MIITPMLGALGLLSLTTATTALAPSASVREPPARAPAQVLTAEVRGLRSDAGILRCSLFKKPDGFPSDTASAVAAYAVAIKDRAATCVFPNLEPGIYAVAVLHDANSNGKMDTNFLGIPTEGWAVSNDARGTLGPPSFGDARVRYPGGSSKIVVRMVY